MRYLIIGFILLGLIGCGSSDTKENKNDDTIITPISPTLSDKTKQPPSIPNI